MRWSPIMPETPAYRNLTARVPGAADWLLKPAFVQKVSEPVNFSVFVLQNCIAQPKRLVTAFRNDKTGPSANFVLEGILAAALLAVVALAHKHFSLLRPAGNSHANLCSHLTMFAIVNLELWLVLEPPGNCHL